MAFGPPVIGAPQPPQQAQTDSPFSILQRLGVWGTTPQASGTQVAATTKIPWASLSPQDQQLLVRQSRELKDGPELNKYDESLYQYGSVILPGADTFGPKEWQDKTFGPDIERYDMPDGRVILRRSGFGPATS